MDAYVCSKAKVPKRLYRINYPESQTVFSSTTGLSAADTTKIFSANDLTEFKQAIRNQFTWDFRGSPPFISLFSDREHAENWGCKEPWCGEGGPVGNRSLHVIDTTRLEGTSYLFKLNILMEVLHLSIPVCAGEHIRGAYLCLHHIPRTAIVETMDCKQVK
ncbi:uncharacterized protein K460DRAFT_264164, partial [Cucurbitaria berberidis CBS 394.84]